MQLLVCLLLVSGCASYRAPSIREHDQILHALTDYMNEHGGPAPKAKIIETSPMDIRIHNKTAVVRYYVTFEHGQFASYPMKTELTHVSRNSWIVTAHKEDRPWYRRLKK